MKVQHHRIGAEPEQITSIRLPAGMYRELRLIAAARDEYLRQVVCDAIAAYLAEQRAAGSAA